MLGLSFLATLLGLRDNDTQIVGNYLVDYEHHNWYDLFLGGLVLILEWENGERKLKINLFASYFLTS